MNRSTPAPRWTRYAGWLVGIGLLAGCDAWDLPHLPGRVQPVDTTRTNTLTTGLIAYYAFSGTTLDASGNNLNGLMINGASYGADRSAGSRSALLLDGVDDYFEVPDNSQLRPDALSVSLWIRPQRVTSTSHLYNKSVWSDHINQQYSAFIRPAQPTSSGNPGCEIWADVNQDGLCSIEQPIQQPISYYDPTYEMNRWYHIVTVFSGKTGKLYVNGDLKRSEPDLPANAFDKCAGGNLRFGAQASFDVNYFDGSMDEIRLYNRPLTDVEVKALYKL
ncbi:LamG domain-containing protein [Spirosoma arcticum]